jgi:hypothetical protein
MGRVSDVETYLLSTGKIRCYTDKVANNNDVVTVQLLANGLQTIYLPQNRLLDNGRLRALQVIAEDEQYAGYLPDGTVVENLTVASLPNFTFSFGMNNEEIATAPFVCLHRSSNAGKFYFFDSNPGNHRIGDCFIQQIGAGNFAGRTITLKFWYD